MNKRYPHLEVVVDNESSVFGTVGKDKVYYCISDSEKIDISGIIERVNIDFRTGDIGRVQLTVPMPVITGLP